MGLTIAVCLETPFILAASWGVSKMLMKRAGVDTAIRSRVLVGAIALVLLTILEIALAVSVFHRSIGEYFAGL